MTRMPTNCDRCDRRLVASIMSRFNTDTICLNCETDERAAPNYQKATEAEVSAVRSGVRNFPGIGLAPEDEEFLAKRRSERRAL